MASERMVIKPVITVRAAREKVFFGPGVLQILEALVETGSMKEACARSGISYSKGWKILNLAESQIGFTIVNRSHGGSSGGGCSVTAEGRLLMDRYKEAREKICCAAEQIFAQTFAGYSQDSDD